MSDQGVKYKITADVEQAGKDIDNFSKRSRVALTNLTQVVQDLPYGFIGIQNNLPYLVSSFNELTKEVGGADKAIVSLINQLRGTVGLVFAFSAVTSVITFLIQEFGSLGNAYDAIFKKTTAAALAEKEYKKALTESSAAALTEKASIQELINVIGNVNQKYSDRVSAFNQLEKLNSGHIKGIKDEAEAIKMTNKEWDQYLILFQKQTNLKIQAKAIEAALSTAYKKFNEDLDKLGDKDILFGLNQILKGFSRGEFNIPLAFLEGAKKTTQDYVNIINRFNVQWKNTQKELRGVNEQLGAGGGFKDTKEDVKQLSTQVEDLANKWSLETQIAELQKLRTTLLDVTYVERNGQKVTTGYVATELERTQALKDLQQIYPEMFKNMTTQMNSYKNLDDLTFTLIRRLQEQRDEIIANGKASATQAQADKNSENAINQKNKALEDEFENLVKVSMANDALSTQVIKINKINLDAVVAYNELTDAVSILTEYYKRLDAQQIKTGNFITRYLRNPLEELFDVVLSKGKNKWKEFGDAVVKQLKRIAAQQLATAAASLIANIISPGSGAAISRGLRGIGTDVLGDYLGNTGGLDYSAFQGGMSLSGQVVFVQRGSDLVGVLNRTNATINRVG